LKCHCTDDFSRQELRCSATAKVVGTRQTKNLSCTHQAIFWAKIPTFASMRNIVKQLLRTLLRSERYLYALTLFKIKTFKQRKKDHDFSQFLNLLDADDHVLDIGSSGMSTVLISKKVDRGEVYSFEPEPVDFIVLKRIVKEYTCKNVNLYLYTLSNQTEIVDTVLSEKNEAEITANDDEENELYDKKSIINKEYSKFYPLKSIESLKKVKISGIKISIENFDYLALESVSDLLENDDPVIYAELKNKQNRQRCFEFIKPFRYKIFVYHDNEFQNYNSEKHDTQNFFFLK